MGKKISWSQKKIGVGVLLALMILASSQTIYEKMNNPMVLDSRIQGENLLEPMAQSGELLLRTQGEGAVFLSAEETHRYFLENIKGWVVQRETSPLDLAPDLTLYLNLAEDYKVVFYGSEPELAMVQRMNRYQYFKIPKGTYEKLAFDYSIRSYLVVEPLMKAIADGKLSKRQSVNDAPANGTYQSAQIGNFTYYFYKQSGKYFVEAPYFFIKELSKEVYEEAVAAIPQ